MYGNQFKQLCDQNFATSFISLIQKYIEKSKKSDPDLEQNVDIFKSYYINN